MPATETTVARAAIARRNEDLVLAEAELVVQRVVCFVRLAMLLLLGSSQLISQAFRAEPLPLDLPKTIVFALYFAFSVVTYLVIRGAKPSTTAAMYAPLVQRVVDFSFITLMGIRDWDGLHVARPERAGVVAALVLCFTVGSYHPIQVILSVLFACASFATVTLNNHTANVEMLTFTFGCFASVGLLAERTSRHVRTMFLNLRKRDNLSRMLPPQIVERSIQLESSLAPTSREVTVLFSDIRNFTTLSESMAPRDVLAFLDEYFSHMQQIVKGHSGIVNKFLGDGMLAFWGVPDRLENHAELAVRAAVDMRRKLVELNGHWAGEGRKPIAIGIGIHTGMVAAGLLGGADQHEYTVIGDAVNVASRVEGLTKQFGLDLLLTEDTARHVQTKWRCERVGEERVKGRERPVTVFTVSGSAVGTPAPAA